MRRTVYELVEGSPYEDRSENWSSEDSQLRETLALITVTRLMCGVRAMLWATSRNMYSRGGPMSVEQDA